MTVSPGQVPPGHPSANHNPSKNYHELGGSKVETGFIRNQQSPYD
jgi:hypothetical protein